MKKITLLDLEKNRTRKTKRWLGWLAFCTMFLCGNIGFAQVSAYSFSQSEGVFTSIVTDGDIVTGTEATTGTTNDTSGWTVNIPFSFNFNGGNYTAIYVNSNGGATFGSTTSTSSSLISATTAYEGAIAVMNRDLWGVFITSGVTTIGSDVITDVGNFYGLEIGKQLNNVNGIPSGATVTAFDEVAGTITMSAPATSSSASVVVRYGSGKIFTKTEGTAPNRVFVIEWSGYNDWSAAVTGSNYMSFQLRLEETSNAISIVYGGYFNVSTTNRTNQIGLRGASTADFNNRLGAVGNPWNSTSQGTESGSTVSRDNTNFPASGLTFSWNPPSCLIPSNLTASNPTLTSIDLSWDGVGGASGNYEIKWGTTGFDIDAATAIPVTGLTHTLVGTGGSYEFVVREVCDTNDESSWSAPYNFSIPNLGDDCSAPIVVSTLPYTTTDDTANYTNNPNIEGSPGASGCGTTSNYLNGNDVVYTYTAAFDGVINVQLTGLTATYAGIFAYASCADIGVACIGSAYGSGTTDRGFEMNVTSGDTYYFVISTWATPQTVGYTLDISQVLCAKPIGVAHTDVTHNSANVSWDVSGDYEINWGTGTFVAGDGANTDTVTAATEFLFTGLNGSTAYRYFVRQNCGGTDGDSDWVGPYTFTTLLAPASTPWMEGFITTTIPTGWAQTGFSFGAPAGITNAPGGAEGNTIYKNLWSSATSGNFQTIRVGLISEGDILSFIHKTHNFGDPYAPPAANSGNFIIAISTDNGANYTNIQTITNDGVSEGWQNFEYDLSSYDGEYVRIRISATRTAGDYYLAFDNFYIGQPITCEAPTALTASNITTNTADLSWTSGGSTFDISWGAGTFDAEDGTIVTFANGGTLSGLASQTSYQYYVRQDCGAVDGVSMWIGPFGFTTDCDPLISLDEDFDSYATGNIVPECWTRLVPTTSVGSQSISSTTPASGTRNIYQYATTSQNPVIVVLPSFSNVNDGTHWLKFNARVSSGAPGALHVGYVTDAADYDSFVLIETLAITNTSYAADAEYTVVVPTSVPAGAKLAIKNAADGKSYYWDDVIWEETPSCLAPTALTATDITSNSAVLGWTSEGTLFDIEIVEDGETPTGTPTYAGVTNDFVTNIDLTPSTSYEFYVRQDCGSGQSTWTGPFSFTTECLSPNITATIGDTLCGQGEATLSATADAGATISWYAAQTGGAALGTGATFTTPLISETTSYWVEASEIGGMQNAGKPAPPTGATGSTLNNWGIRLTANEAVTLESVTVYSTAAGTLNVKITDGAGVELYETGNISITGGGISDPNIITLNYPITSGDYRVLVKSYTGVSLIRDSSGLTFPYVGTDGTVSVTSSEWGGTTTGTYYYFYDLKYIGKCSSERTEVIATVTDAPEFALSETTVDICEGETTDTITITTGASDYDTYVWEPSTGVTGDATNGWTFNPTETTTYVLTASQSSGSECTIATEVQVNVNSLPVAITVEAAEEICENGILELSVTGNTNNGIAVLGDGTSAPTSTANAPNPLSAYYGGTKHQMLYTAAELTAQGMIAGNLITEVTFDLAGTGAGCTDFTIRMGATTVDVMSSGFVSGTSTVYGPATFTPTSTGLVTFELATPYVWDGVSNLVVETVHNAGNTGNGSGSNTRYTTTPSNSVAYLRADTTSGGIAGFDALTTTPAFSDLRPNMTFTYTLEQTDITWLPAMDLYTDEDATVPYVADTYSTTVYFKSSTLGNVTYTATSYTDFGCSVSDSVEISVNPIPNQPVIACYETATFNADTCEWEVTGEQPEQPVLACYETATFNEVMCQWDVTGEQPEQPVLACYETATFNTTSCQWDITGEQPEEPILACYETATFNDLTCQWDVTGEQPEEPIFACYETAIFNTTTCQWDVTGEQPEEPTTLACYETATFNEVTCQWDVTGEQPAAPTAVSPQTMTEEQTVSDIIVSGDNLTWYSDSDLTTIVDESFVLTEGTHTFWVTQTIEGCESDAIEIQVEVTLSTDRFDTASFKAYPNPVKDFFNISYSNDITDVMVINMLGQTVLSKAVNATDTQIDMSLLPTGTYFVKVNIDGFIKTIKVVKQ